MMSRTANPIPIAEVANMTMERIDIAMLEALEKAPGQTLRWEDRIERIARPAVSGERRVSSELAPGLETLTNEFCDERPDLTTIHFKKESVRFKDGHVEEYTPEPLRQYATLARLTKMVGAQLIAHLGTPDEETAKQGTRELQLSESGAKVLKLWREGRIQGVPYPDPKPPTKAKEAKDQGKDEDRPRSGATNPPQDHPATVATAPSPTAASKPPTRQKS